ncbi:MAG: pyridoxal phosphate-dependent aminotransferase [Fimbriimonadaceae bacterium]
MPTLSNKSQIPRPSPTLSITARARALAAEGHDIISFAAGEPDFNTPDPICGAAKQALDQGMTKYAPTAGLPALRSAISRKLADQNGLTYAANQIAVTCGAKQALFNAIWAIASEGDEIILISPFWMTYEDQVRVAGATPVIVEALPENGFIPLVEDLETAVTPRTKAILVNSPCNPTGAVFPRNTLVGIAELARKHDLWIVTDEIYENLVYEGEQISIGSLSPDALGRTITIGGFSKSFSMTGWRVGYLAAPPQITEAAVNLQDQVTSGATTFAQVGALKAIGLDPAATEHMRLEFDKRRNLAHEELLKIPGIVCAKPAGAFYLLFDARAYLNDAMDDVALTQKLLDTAGVALIPGTVFGRPGFLRLSYTASEEDIVRGIGKLQEAFAQL